jgi:hypothetical protein
MYVIGVSRKRIFQILIDRIEVACKTVVGQRLKGLGMRWSEAGADAVCCLHALFKREGDPWDAFWETRIAA